MSLLKNSGQNILSEYSDQDLLCFSQGPVLSAVAIVWAKVRDSLKGPIFRIKDPPIFTAARVAACTATAYWNLLHYLSGRPAARAADYCRSRWVLEKSAVPSLVFSCYLEVTVWDSSLPCALPHAPGAAMKSVMPLS